MERGGQAGGLWSSEGRVQAKRAGTFQSRRRACPCLGLRLPGWRKPVPWARLQVIVTGDLSSTASLPETAPCCPAVPQGTPGKLQSWLSSGSHQPRSGPRAQTVNSAPGTPGLGRAGQEPGARLPWCLSGAAGAALDPEGWGLRGEPATHRLFMSSRQASMKVH